MSQPRATLELAGTEVVAGEDPLCRLTVVNPGSSSIKVPNPELNAEWPMSTLQDLESGELRSFVPGVIWADDGIKTIARREGDGPLVVLAPGEERTWTFQLSHRIHLPRPGYYRLVMSFPAGDAEVHTDPLPFHVQRVEVARADLTYAHSGYDNLFSQCWVGREQQGGDAARGSHGGGADRARRREERGSLYLRTVAMRKRPRQLQCLRIGRVPMSVEPLLSVAPNGGAAGSRCVAWLDGDAIVAVDVGAAGVVRPERSLRLPPSPRFLLPRLWKDPASEDTVAVVWLEQPDGDLLLPFEIRRDGISARPAAPIRLPRPLWARAFFRSNGDRLACFLVPGAGHLALYQVQYRHELVIARTPMATWDCHLLGIAAHLDRHDTLHGVLVGQRLDAGPAAQVSYSRWSLDAEGRFSAEPLAAWPDLDPRQLDHFQVAVDANGQPHALVQSAKGDWACVAPDARHVVLAAAGGSGIAAPTLRFVADGTIPLVLWHDPSRGLICVPIGSEMPDYASADFIEPPMTEQKG